MGNAHDGEYSRAVLNGDGCVYGRNLSLRFDTWKLHLKEELKEDYKARMDKMEQKLDRLTWAAVGVMISLVTATLTAWVLYFAP